ncbi:MAG: thiolase family protein [Acidimicrobiales bacterium]
MRASIVAAARTPIGKRRGSLRDVRPDDLLAGLILDLVEQSGVAPGEIDDVIVGCSTPVGEQGWNIARQAALIAGLPHSVPGVTVNRMCASSDQAVRYAVRAVESGDASVVVAAGVESMSRVEMTSDGTSFSPRLNAQGITLPQQGKSAELIARAYELPRDELDELAVESHRRASAAAEAGLFDAEIVVVKDPEGEALLCRDEGVRAGTSFEALAALPPAFVEDGVITAGNSSQMSDGAAGVLVMADDVAKYLGLAPRARLVSAATVGSDPVLQLTGVVEATGTALKRAGIALDDLDHVEVNEAFAPVPLVWMRNFGFDPARVNPLGGAMALGHPLGATGARILVTMIHALERAGGGLGMQTMCIGHGMANATVFEVDPS